MRTEPKSFQFPINTNIAFDYSLTYVSVVQLTTGHFISYLLKGLPRGPFLESPGNFGARKAMQLQIIYHELKTEYVRLKLLAIVHEENVWLILRICE